MNSFYNNLRQYEIAEARKRMGMGTDSTASGGVTNQMSGTGNMTSGNSPSLNDSTAVGYQEKEKAKQDMNSYGYTGPTEAGMTNYMGSGTNANPSLSASKAVGSAEIQKTKQNMNQTNKMY